MKLMISFAFKTLWKDKKSSLLILLCSALTLSLVSFVFATGFGLVESSKREMIKYTGHTHVVVNGLNYHQSQKLCEDLDESLVTCAMFGDSSNLLMTEKENMFDLLIMDFAKAIKLLPDEQEFIITYGRMPKNNHELLYFEDYSPDGPSVSLNDKIENTQTHEAYTVVGIVSFGDIPKSWRNFFFVNRFVMDSSIEEHENILTYTALRIRFKDGSKNVVNRVNDALKNIPDAYASPASNELNTLLGMGGFLSQTITILMGVSSAIALLFIMMTSSLIANAFQVFVSRQNHSYGILRSVGATRKQIVVVMRIQLFVISLLSAVLGIGAGYVMSSSVFAVLGSSTFKHVLIPVLSPLLPREAIILVILSCLLLSFIVGRKTSRQLFNNTTIEIVKNKNDLILNEKRYLNESKLIPSLAKTYTKVDKKQFSGIRKALLFSLVLFISLSSFMKLVYKTAAIEAEIPPYDLIINVNGRAMFEEDLNTQIKNALETNKSLITSHQAYIEIVDLELFDANGTVPLSKDYLDYMKEVMGVEELSDKYLSVTARIRVLIVEDNFLDEPDKILFRNYHHDESYSVEGQETYKGDLLDFDQEAKVHFVYEVLREETTQKPHYKQTYSLVEVDKLPNQLESLIAYNDLMRRSTVVMSQSQAQGLLAEIASHDYLPSISKSIVVTTEESGKLHEALTKELGENTNLDIYDSHAPENVRDAYMRLGENILMAVTAVMVLSVILNIISLSISNLQKRRSQLAILRSMGMEKKELQKMLVWESVYTLGQPLILGTLLGILIALASYFVMNYYMGGLPLSIAFDPKTILMAWSFVLIVVFVNYVAIYNEMKQFSIVEDIRQY